ncbi:MAG: CDP-diacylglycerol--glycerol-3-phosphate 3-phosphatidyltransferase [Gammaproteobacteria bacterium]|nr:CDP-diacylglycerol--glycerol-3-phosphate 3-phosphatidyltransferase [Gammaproteobacteria bacterium]|tara:strand:- start:650 stop:1249 length:600 start_codon:yes stop_codon:yes gene_type:complete
MSNVVLTNLPNLLTLARILLIPVFVIVYAVPGEGTYLIAATLFALAAFTDWLDGYLARRMNQTTAFGAFLDPVADKLIVVTALVILIGHHHTLWLTLPGLVIIGREIAISALREWMAEMNRRGIITVSWLGRVKTTFQMVAVVVLLANPPAFDRPWVLIGYVLLYVAAVMTLLSMVIYLRAAWPAFMEGVRDSDHSRSP